jgi:hypothetical protein
MGTSLPSPDGFAAVADMPQSYCRCARQFEGLPRLLTKEAKLPVPKSVVVGFEIYACSIFQLLLLRKRRSCSNIELRQAFRTIPKRCSH